MKKKADPSARKPEPSALQPEQRKRRSLAAEIHAPLPLLRQRLHQAIEHARESAARRLPGDGGQP